MNSLITPRSILTELGVLGVFLIGVLVSRKLKRRWHPTEVAVMYSLGLLFEVLTCHMWHYHYIFLIYPLYIANDISVVFPLGWAGLIMTATPIAEKIWKKARVKLWIMRHLILMGTWLIVGDTAETIFCNIGMIEYINNEATKVNFLLGQAPYLPPTVVLVGYGLLQPFVSWFLRWMELGLSERKASSTT